MYLSLIAVVTSICLFIFSSQAASGNEIKTNAFFNGIEFVYVRPGSFLMGCPARPPSPWVLEKNAQPEHLVSLSAFYLSKHPITVQQFVLFLNSVGMKDNLCDKGILFNSVNVIPKGRFIAKDGMQSRPMTGVTHAGAKAFCTWFGANIGQECRLPTEAEWEYAARGKVGRTYPWGDSIRRAAVWNDDVGMHPELATVDGVHDLNGPILQWCLDGFDSQFYTKSPVNDPINMIGDGRFVLRGGPMMRYGKNEELVFPPAWKRFARKTVDRIIPHIGFRVVLVLSEVFSVNPANSDHDETANP